MTDFRQYIAAPEMTRNVLSGDTNYPEVFDAVIKHIDESVPLVRDLSLKYFAGHSEKEAARLVYEFIAANVRYQNDPAGIEQLALANRTLYNGYGDCDDMAILAASLLIAAGYTPHIYIVRTGLNEDWNHIFVTLGNRPHPDDKRIKGYVIDPVPPMTHFDELCSHIQATMELHSLRGTTRYLAGIAGIQEIDGVAHEALGREMQLLESFRQARTPEQRARIGKDFRKNRSLIMMTGTPERMAFLGLMPYIDTIDDQGRIHLKQDVSHQAVIDYVNGHRDLSGLAGDIGAAQASLGATLAKTAKANSAGNTYSTAQNVANVLNQLNPGTIAARNAAYELLKMNLFRLGTKLSLGYLTEAQAMAKGLEMTEWRKLKDVMPKIENVFYVLGANPVNFKNAVLQGRDLGLKRQEKRDEKNGTNANPAAVAPVTNTPPTVPGTPSKKGINGLDGDMDQVYEDAIEFGLGNPALIAAAAEMAPVIAPIVASAVVAHLNSRKAKKAKGINGLDGGLGDPTLAAVLTAASGVLASIAGLTKNISFKSMTAKAADGQLDDDHQDPTNEKKAGKSSLLDVVSNVFQAAKDLLPITKPASDKTATDAFDAGSPTNRPTTPPADNSAPNDNTALWIGGAGLALLALFGLGGKKRK